jgi:hypothetical protein
MHWMPCTIFRYELELQPTGEVEQYSASTTYELQRQEKALVDTLKFVIQAEGEYLKTDCSFSVLSPRLQTHENIFNAAYLTSIY